MNIKGLKLCRSLINKLLEKKIDVSKLRGIESFNSFQWNGFNNEEFYNLLDAFNMFDKKLFLNCSDEYLFVFNYSTDVTEMDIVTVMSMDGEPIFIDVEIKNGRYDIVSKSIDEQIEKRKNDHLPQLIKNSKYITIGIINNNFYEAYFYNGNNHEKISEEKCLTNLFEKLVEFESVDEYLIKFSDMASIAKVCKDIRNKEYHFYEETNKIYSNLCQKINENKAVFIYGNAGTGKSVLALRFFFENETSKLLVLNSKLYFALDLGGRYYFEDKSMINSKDFISSIDSNSLAIVDEAQRLSLDEIETIIKKSKVALFFGDNRQAWRSGNTLKSSKELKKYFTELGYNVSEKTLTKSRRYSDEVNMALNFLTSKDSKFDGFIPNNYKINVFYDEAKFINEYDNVSGLKKIFVPAYDVNGSIKLNNRVFERASKTDDNFSLMQGYNGLYGTTYHALSFDVEHNFVYLPKTNVVKFDKKYFLFSETKEKNIENIDLYLNELNILFTRGRKSLNILCDNIEAYLFLKSRVNKLSLK